jgi:thiosulfate/3-mercaptopyruvate sulfurtransferase
MKSLSNPLIKREPEKWHATKYFDRLLYKKSSFIGRFYVMLISPSELSQKIAESSCVVFDCRFRLGQPAWGQEAYTAGHLPTAFFLDLERDLSAPVSTHGGRHPLPDAQTLADKLSAFGVTAEKTVVVYDGGEGMAPHAWWLMRYLGHSDVRILNGGLAAWQQAGYETTADITPPHAGNFPFNVHTERVVDREFVMRILTGETPGVLIDARASERFRGEIEPIDPRAGHIPTAQNAPWQEGVDAQGAWLNAKEQRQRFQADMDCEQPLVLYCGSGVTACANAFALHLAGHTDYRLYAGSWSDWVSYADAPVAVETEPEAL